MIYHEHMMRKTGMNTAVTCLLAMSLCTTWSIPDLGSEEQSATAKFRVFMHNNMERQYLIHLPDGLPENAPLVFMLHGYSQDARDYVELGMNHLADKKHFAVCYPQGTKDYRGITHWNARLNISQSDDVDFLSSLASHLQTHHSLNAGKTFVCGISNGGFMSYTLVAEKPDVFKAAASVIGTMSGYTWENRHEIQPVPILQISGMQDKVVPYDGSMEKDGGWGGAPNQDVIMEFWMKLNQTTSQEDIQLSSSAIGLQYKNGINGNEVWHYKIKNFGHRIPGEGELGDDLSEIIWRFFSRI